MQRWEWTKAHKDKATATVAANVVIVTLAHNGQKWRIALRSFVPRRATVRPSSVAAYNL